jgi:pyrroline-5-carboxylate reductase
MKVGFVGSGNMAAALARGLAGAAEPPELLFSDSGSGRAARLAAALPGAAASSTRDLADAADLLILAVKPAALERVAAELAPAATPVVSLLGATPLTELRAALPEAPLLRTMPNVAVEVGRGLICHAPPTDPGALTAAIELLGSVAELVEMPEGELDAATAVMGCSPAYLALACEELVLAGEEAGLDPALALRLVSETAAGTGELLTRRGPAELQAMVASPGGSTEAGLRALADAGAREAFRAAVRASLARMEGAG